MERMTDGQLREREKEFFLTIEASAGEAIMDELRRARAVEEALKKKLERAKRALEAAAPHHQGGHSEVGRKIRRALDEMEKP